MRTESQNSTSSTKDFSSAVTTVSLEDTLLSRKVAHMDLGLHVESLVIAPTMEDILTENQLTRTIRNKTLNEFS